MVDTPIVFFDLDGTLLTSEFKVANSSIDAIKTIKKLGAEPVIATGRNISEIGNVLELTGIRSCVAMNGQYVMYEGKVIYENPLDQNEVKLLHTTASQNGHDLAFYNAEYITVTAGNSDVITKNYIERVGTKYPPVDETMYLKSPIHLMVLFCNIGEELYYQEQFPYFQFVRHSPLGCDVYPRDTSKASGIQRLMEHQNLSLENSYAFGDGLNDIEMFQLVKHPIAMGNAVENLKSISKYVTTSNNEDGIMKGLHQCGLLDSGVIK
ncbi:Cof-type HAD-IIB family hydrolase [Metabacillus litoralis]|uniref:Cof-type HAD-IIB family hydrolase n=1 Tax=Metabacillus litoralis TaxID=152268 RepID=UPI0013CEB175|nr:Cof-type HAD-IIB family hydrolase [Metabacillus litoralis]MCM3411719.1 Cof-type HAD-IIB family hydrolase [Metabacillus litoralis]